jgi:hypothetical protein
MASEVMLDVNRAHIEEVELVSGTPSRTHLMASSVDCLGLDDAEEAALLEQMELEELMGLKMEDQGQMEFQSSGSVPSDYDSEEYDSIFMEFITEHPEVEQAHAHHFAMDMSNS